MKHLSIFMIATALMLLSSSCEKVKLIPDHPTDEYGLPEYSETGRGTLACLINGKPFIVDRRGGFSRNPTGVLNITSGKFYGGGSQTIEESNSFININLSLYLDDFNPVKFYNVSNDSIKGGGNITDFKSCNHPYFQGIEYKKNWINVAHFDTDAAIISGYFEFKLINTLDNECRDTFHITQGRFDLSLEYIN